MRTLLPSEGSLKTASLRLWNNDTEPAVSRSRAVFECPDCNAVVMGMQSGFVKCDCCDDRYPAHFAICLHCSSAYIVIVAGNEYTIRDMSLELDPETVKETITELKGRMSRLPHTNA